MMLGAMCWFSFENKSENPAGENLVTWKYHILGDKKFGKKELQMGIESTTLPILVGRFTTHMACVFDTYTLFFKESDQ